MSGAISGHSLHETMQAVSKACLISNYTTSSRPVESNLQPQAILTHNNKQLYSKLESFVGYLLYKHIDTHRVITW